MLHTSRECVREGVVRLINDNKVECVRVNPAEISVQCLVKAKIDSFYRDRRVPIHKNPCRHRFWNLVPKFFLELLSQVGRVAQHQNLFQTSCHEEVCGGRSDYRFSKSRRYDKQAFPTAIIEIGQYFLNNLFLIGSRLFPVGRVFWPFLK